MSTPNGIDLLASVVAASINASKVSAKLIRLVKATGTMDTKSKSEKTDYVTEADLKSQQIIVKYLKTLFPGINCRGEEGKLSEYKEHLDTELNHEAMQIINHSRSELLRWRPDYAKITEQDLFVWIDPLDGTREYVMEDDKFNEEVTVLIGIAYKGRPIAGIINQPYYTRTEPNKEFRDGIVWGIVGLGVYHDRIKNVAAQNVTFQRYEVDEEEYNNIPRKIVTSRAHATPVITDNLNKIPGGEIVYRGGCGYKVIVLLDKDAQCYLYPSRGLKRWDTCAPEAIVRALGGEWTDVFNERYDYSNVDVHAYENTLGTVAAIRNQNFYMKHLSSEIICHVWEESLKEKRVKIKK